MRECFIVGCARSGTSMTTGILARAGYSTGNRLIPADSANPAGYFEDFDVNAINDELLAPYMFPYGGHDALRRPLSTGEHWMGLLPRDTAVLPTPRQWVRMAATAGQTAPRALKDPQFCYTLPLWWAMLPDAVNVCVFREPTRTAHSLLRHVGNRDVGFGFDEALRLWTASYRYVLRWHELGGDWVFCHYEQLLDGSALPLLEEVLDVGLDTSLADPMLRRSPSDGEMPTETADVYNRLCELAGYATGTAGEAPAAVALGS